MDGIVVRPAALDDAAALARCHIACWWEAYDGLVPRGVLAARTSDVDGRRERWLQALAGESRTWLAVEASEVVGFASVGPARDQDLSHFQELYGLYVRARAYGTGLADQLSAPAVGRSPAYLWVLAGNPRALAHYGKSGFRRDGHTKVYEDFGDALAVRMVRR